MPHRYVLADDAPFVDPLARIIAECAVTVQQANIGAAGVALKPLIKMA
jgi:hypothetical protein